MSKTDKQPIAADRRAFLKLTGAGVAAGGAAVVMGGGEAAKATVVADERGAGYSETAHVRKFYETARF